MCILMGVAGCRKKKPALKWSFKEAEEADNESIYKLVFQTIELIQQKTLAMYCTAQNLDDESKS